MPVEKAVEGSVLELGSEPLGRVVIEGENVTLRIGHSCHVQCPIWVMPEARNTVIEIGDGCHLVGAIRVIRGDGGVIRIGDQTTFNEVGVSQHEAGLISFGRNNMLSIGIRMDVSDMHPIYDRSTGARINPPRDIILEDDVWVGMNATIMKGAHIGRGSVVAAGALVTGEVPAHCLVAGVPARVMRENVAWRRDFSQPYEPEAAPSPPAGKPAFWSRRR